MLAVDTNVIVRYLVQDDAAQGRRAAQLMRSNDVWIAKTVLLELDWVLRKTYGYLRRDVAAAIAALCGLPNVMVEDAEAVYNALECMAIGLDFADAIHVASRGEAEGFSTFDKRLLKSGKKLGIKFEEL